MQRTRTICAIIAALVVAAFAAPVALAGNGNGHNGPPSGPGNVCQPGYHGEPAGSTNCVHNGNGGGNCGQNQSGNTGNGGNDNGYGHKKGCGGSPPPGCGSTCPPPPSCMPGETGTPPHCMPPCPAGTTPPPSGTCIQVIVQPGPTTVVVVPCPCNCPKGHPPVKHKAKCPPVKKSRFKASFSPKHLLHGNLHYKASAPKSAHVVKIVTKIVAHRHGKTHVKKFVQHGSTSHLTLPLWRPDIWVMPLWGNYKFVTTFYLKCGKKVVVKNNFFNFDPPKGWVVKNGRLVFVGV
jgi:hypothetical protein